MQTRLIRIKEVIAMTGRSRSSIYADVDKGLFPPKVKIGSKSVAWVEAAVLKWIDDKISSSGAQY